MSNINQHFDKYFFLFQNKHPVHELITLFNYACRNAGKSAIKLLYFNIKAQLKWRWEGHNERSNDTRWNGVIHNWRPYLGNRVPHTIKKYTKV